MTDSIEAVVRSIRQLPQDWHKAGSMSAAVLEGIARNCARIGPVRFSVETGSGKTTLLFSHASQEHKVFAEEGDNGSITQVRNSELFRSENVEYVEGPTQKTLLSYSFKQPIDIALIDGPHGYPFPDLEYWAIYPHIRDGGVLIVDDIKIPTIKRMFDILEADAMWRLLEVVDDSAFFERTKHEGVDPLEDGWWKQGYNQKYHTSLRGEGNPLLRFPQRVVRFAIRRIRRLFRRSDG